MRSGDFAVRQPHQPATPASLKLSLKRFSSAEDRIPPLPDASLLPDASKVRRLPKPQQRGYKWLKRYEKHPSTVNFQLVFR
jgi:hypothetical protein